MILRAALDKINGYSTQYTRIKGHECFILVGDKSPTAPWGNVKDDTFTVPFHQLSADEARLFLRDRFRQLSKDGCILVPYSNPISGQIRFGMVYFPNKVYISFDEKNDMSQPFEPNDLADYLVDIMLVDEVMDN